VLEKKPESLRQQFALARNELATDNARNTDPKPLSLLLQMVDLEDQSAALRLLFNAIGITTDLFRAQQGSSKF
jgi:hypothetical protein